MRGTLGTATAAARGEAEYAGLLFRICTRASGPDWIERMGHCRWVPSQAELQGTAATLQIHRTPRVDPEHMRAILGRDTSRSSGYFPTIVVSRSRGVWAFSEAARRGHLAMGVADGLRATSGPRSRRSKGQSMAEFALVLPILSLLLFGTIQFGMIFGANNGLINSVREAARFGSVCIGPMGPPAGCGGSTQTYLTGQKIPGSVIAYKGLPVAKIEYQAYLDSSAPAMWNTRIRVSGCVASIVFIPLIGNVLGLSDPSAFPLKSVETFRVEGQPSSTAPLGIAQDPNWTVAAAGGC